VRNSGQHAERNRDRGRERENRRAAGWGDMEGYVRSHATRNLGVRLVERLASGLRHRRTRGYAA
jgi:hypothetical protein